MPNEICHVEIVCRDIKAASEFYSAIFGWKIQSMGAEYTIFSPEENPGGGFSPPMPGVDKGVCIYIHVDDIDDTLTEIEKARGKAVVAKSKISDEHGFYALFQDPQDNVIGLWAKN